MKSAIAGLLAVTVLAAAGCSAGIPSDQQIAQSDLKACRQIRIQKGSVVHKECAESNCETTHSCETHERNPGFFAIDEGSDGNYVTLGNVWDEAQGLPEAEKICSRYGKSAQPEPDQPISQKNYRCVSPAGTPSKAMQPANVAAPSSTVGEVPESASAERRVPRSSVNRKGAQPRRTRRPHHLTVARVEAQPSATPTPTNATNQILDSVTNFYRRMSGSGQERGY